MRQIAIASTALLMTLSLALYAQFSSSQNRYSQFSESGIGLSFYNVRKTLIKFSFGS
jgi:hypothetical protein